MSFTNDYSLYPDNIDYVTEGFLSGLGNIFKSILDAIKRFGGWLKERLNDIKEWIVGLRTKREERENEKIVKEWTEAQNLIHKVRKETTEIATVLNNGLKQLSNTTDKNQITEIYGTFASKTGLAQTVIEDVNKIPKLPYLTYSIATSAYAVLYDLSNKNSDMGKAAAAIREVMKDTTLSNERSKILEKFLNLHNKLQSCTTALFKKCASFKHDNGRQNVYAEKMNEVKEINKSRGKGNKLELHDIDAKDMFDAENTQRKITPSKSINVRNDVIEYYKKHEKEIKDNGGNEKDFVDTVTKSVLDKALKTVGGTDAKIIYSRTKKYDSLASEKYAHRIRKVSQMLIDDVSKEYIEKLKKPSNESIITDIVTDFIYQQAYEDAYNEIESRADAAFEAACDEFELSLIHN